MLLAAILGICLLSPSPSSAAGMVLVSEPGQSAPSGTPADAPTPPPSQDSPTAAPQPEKSSAPSSQPAPASTPAQPSPAPPTTHKGRWRRKKRAATADRPNSAGAAKGSESRGATDSAKASGGCSPAKTVVRDGGTSEPTVQLKGSGSTGGSHQGDTAEQLLASTEDKLKKTEGQQLSSTQREMVTQIRQFMDQSKAAAAAGDLNRARNLALKANLLSDELAKPQP
jgi:sialidase-1